MQADTFTLVTQDHYFLTENRQVEEMMVGATLAEVIAQSNLPQELHPVLVVEISKGTQSAVVPQTYWAQVRPKARCHVLISCAMPEGPAAGLILSAILPTAASSLAGALFTNALAVSIATAAFTIVGALAINALIAPPSLADAPAQDDPTFSITGSSNAESRYGIYPVVLGRHLMYPPKTARGYTEGEGDDIHYRGRFTFGYGPVALETLKIGTTPITDFDGVEIEFLNVDQTRTLQNIPQLADKVTAWRSGTEVMTLYPDDVSEDVYSVRLEEATAVMRRTRDRAISASVDITFQGLVRFDDKNRKKQASVTFGFRYRPVGGSWVDLGSQVYSGATTSSVRFTKTIAFNTPAEYEIEVTRFSTDSDDTTVRDDSYLTAVRSVQSGTLPSHADIAEIAVRIKASDQLNGQIETLNAIVQQLAPVWDGAAWSTPQPVRHPAWIYARALMGPMLSTPIAESRMQLEDLRAWANEEPHWTCDLVVDQPAQVAEILDIICATGRARRTLRDLKYSIIRDGGAGPVIQQFTPRNSYDFEGEITFPKDIHGFRVRCISEALEWQQDEIVVYADGFDANTATDFETLDLRGVVLAKDDPTGGNAWRLGRYHLAQAILRPEAFEWSSDLDHLRVNMGDKVRLVHDVPKIGVGYGQLTQLTLTPEGDIGTFVLDEFLSLAGSEYRVRIRTSDGDMIVVRAEPPLLFDGVWTAIDVVSATGIAVGDLVLVEEMTQESFELLVTSIRHENNLRARLRGVPAAPSVLQADQGDIPDYTPIVTTVVPREIGAPSTPILKSVISEILYGPARVVGRIEVEQPDRFDAERYIVTLTNPSGVKSQPGPFQTSTFDVPLDNVGVYQISVTSQNKAGLVSETVFEQVEWDLGLTQPDDVTNFRAHLSQSHVTLTWNTDDLRAKYYDVRHLPLGNRGGWSQAVNIASEVQGGTVTVPALSGTYLIRAMGYWDQQSKTPAQITVTDISVFGLNVVKTLTEEPDFIGTLSGALVRGETDLVLNPGNQLGSYAASEVVDLGGIYACRISADVYAIGYFDDFRMSTWPPLSNLGSLFGDVAESTWAARLMIQTTEDDPTDAGAFWSDWAEFQAGDVRARGFRFRLDVASYDPAVSVLVDRLAITIDMPDRVDGQDNISCPPEGVAIMFTPAFKEAPAINITGRDLPFGAVPRVTNITHAGFAVQFVDAAEAGVSCIFDWVAKGYGRET